jgi:hypothetical protein
MVLESNGYGVGVTVIVHVFNALNVGGVSSLSPFTTWSPSVTVMLR